MAKELWKEIVRLSDFLILTMQTELFFVLYTVTGLIILYYAFKPFVKFVIALEWNTLITYMFVVLLMFLIISAFIDVPDWRYVLYGVLIFSIIISIKRSFTIMKNNQPSSN
ncbi:hypothetical protein SAMN04487943_106187 [Gracilibacillus orientalis]|uniref:Uncharacterized protein n=1 Tax=Gracilibacillus orientalis TaxID=334253 RepID=A0A1I4MDN9_9BACI|nr:hypothetical protein [Gracilibacillus orientalis]SFM01351.1 hypothetical protein SAMN04487943_106187 [Gracilibacillus orientalis]